MAIDKVTLEVLNNYTHAVAESMAYTLIRTAYTTFVKETQDFTTALATPEGEFFAYPKNMAATWFVGLNMGDTISLIKDYEENDICLSNDPYAGFFVTHTPDFHLWKPAFYKGELVCFLTNHIHNTDVGGSVPATLSRGHTEIFQEGIRIPPQKLYRAGVLNEDLVDIIKNNVRIPEQNWGDLKAQVASLNTGENKVHEMIEKFGINTFREGMYQLIDYAEERVRSIISRIPDGEYFFADYMDDDVVSDMPIRIAINMKVREDEIVLDFTGSDPQLLCSMNVPTGGKPNHVLPAIALFYYFMTVDPQIPLNGGVMRPISSVLPRGTMLNPEFPAAVGMRSATVPRIQDVTLGCLMKVVPDQVPACPSGHVTIIVVSLQDPKTGKRFVSVINPMIGGGGASCSHDGSNAAGGFFTFLCNTPVETNEAEVPISILRYELITDSGGAGKYRGGLGVRLDMIVPQPNASITARNRDRSRFRPWGVRGGKAASPSRFVLNPGTPKERDLGDLDVVKLEPGDIVSIWAPGGGGYGSPLDRDPQAVLRDTQAQYISLSAAREQYGVIISDNKVDLKATEDLRAKMRSNEKRELFDFGPERDAYEAVWSEAVYGALTDLLMEMPTSLRSFAKRKVYEEVKQMATKGHIKPEDIGDAWQRVKEKNNLTMEGD